MVMSSIVVGWNWKRDSTEVGTSGTRGGLKRRDTLRLHRAIRDRPAASRIFEDPAHRGVKKTRFRLASAGLMARRPLYLALSFLIESRLSARIRLLDGPELTIATICLRRRDDRLIEDKRRRCGMGSSESAK